MRPEPGARRGADIRYDLDLTLDEAAKGGERVIEMTRSEQCSTCKGSGAKPGTKPTVCSECRGGGQKQSVQTSKGVRMVTLTTCPKCGGRGQWVESPCDDCRGSGFRFRPHTLKTSIPAGVDDGMVIRLAGQGEVHADGGPPGDLLFRTHLRPHPTLQRQGDDLYAAVTIGFPEAALGTKASLTTLGGEALEMAIPAGTQSGTAMRLRGKGMPRLGGKGRGDLFAIVEVRTPTNLTDRQRELLQEFATTEKGRQKK